MSRLSIACQRGASPWVSAGSLGPDDPPGSLSDNTPGGRELYLFACAGEWSRIYRSRTGVDQDLGEGRIVYLKEADVIATLRPGDPPYEMAMRPDGQEREVRVRFTHSA